MNTSPFQLRTVLLAAVLGLGIAVPARAGTSATQTQTFTVAAGAKIVVGTNKSATLGDIKPGDHVGLAYANVSGVLTASHIRDFGANPVRHARTAGAKKPATPAASTALHAHGIVASVDVQAQTLTINERQHHKAAGNTTTPPPATTATP
jgi:hypothetical protein